jgi:hypothetical protein
MDEGRGRGNAGKNTRGKGHERKKEKNNARKFCWNKYE